MIHRFVTFLGSTKFTLFLILALVCVFLLGLWIPQKSLLQQELYLQWRSQVPAVVAALDALELTNIYLSPITLTLWALFFLNLSLVMGKRIPVVRRKIALPGEQIDDPETAPGFPQKARIPLPPGQGINQSATIIRQAGYRIIEASDRFLAVKNRLSPVANLIFHLSFFLMLLGGVVSVYTRFAGTLDLAEGEVFRGDLSQYGANPSLPKVGTVPQAQFLVEKIEPQVVQGMHTGLRVTIADMRGARHVADINRPYRTDSTSFVILSLGVAPLIVVYDRKGTEVDGAYVKLNVLKKRQDGFTIAGFDIIATFFPDHVERYGADDTLSDEIRNPAFHLNVQKDGRPIGRGTARVGESVRVGDYRLEVRELPYWIRFYVVKERGLMILFSGFIAAAAALFWRLLFYRREIIGAVRTEGGSDMLYLAGKAEFYKVLFDDEFSGLVCSLAGSGAGPAKDPMGRA